MKLVRQPKGSSVCGQACVATLGGITLARAILLTNRTGKTTTKDIKRALMLLDIRHDDRRKRGMPGKDVTAMLFWTSHDKKERHWTVWYKGKHYDPAAGIFRKTPKHLENGRVTSYLRVYYGEEETETQAKAGAPD